MRCAPMMVDGHAMQHCCALNAPTEAPSAMGRTAPDGAPCEATGHNQRHLGCGRARGTARSSPTFSA